MFSKEFPTMYAAPAGWRNIESMSSSHRLKDKHDPTATEQRCSLEHQCYDVPGTGLLKCCTEFTPFFQQLNERKPYAGQSFELVTNVGMYPSPRSYMLRKVKSLSVHGFLLLVHDTFGAFDYIGRLTKSYAFFRPGFEPPTGSQNGGG